MTLSLPQRIFLAHLVFMLALGGLSLLLVKRAFDGYRVKWESQQETLLAQNLFSPLANEVARSLLLKVETGPRESQEEHRRTFRGALDEVLPTLPSIERLFILDPELRVQYAYEPEGSGLAFADGDYTSRLTSDVPTRREIMRPSGEAVAEVVAPVFERPGSTDDGAPPRKLGSVVVQYRFPDAAATTPEKEGREHAGSDPSPEAIVTALAGYLAGALLREPDPEAGEPTESAISVSDGLKTVLSVLPLEALAVVDRDLRIRYINDSKYLDLTYTDPDMEKLLASDVPVRQEILLGSGEAGLELMLPVFDEVRAESGTGEGRRLGSLLIRYRPDPRLIARIPDLPPPSVAPRDFIQPLMLFLAVAVGGGILLAALTGVPVRRMERALEDFRARGFKGGLDPGLASLPKDLASTVQAVSELGGRLEAMDGRSKDREALLATLSQSLEDGMVAIDPDGAPVAWNPAALRILGAASSDASQDGRTVSEGDVLREALGRNGDLLLDGYLEGTDPTREVEILHADGSYAPARVTHVSSEVHSGEAGTLLVIRDLAALRKVETHLLEAGRFAVLAHLAASLAHEIRNPLHSIQLNAAVVEQYVDLSGTDKGSRAVAESLTTLKDEAQRLADLLNNYLGLVRPGKEMRPVDTRDLCRRVIQLVTHAARQSNVEIRFEGEEHLPLIHGAPNHLQQAILNLVLNAIQAMPTGGVLTLGTHTSPGAVRLTVSDTGPGLSQELSDRLFDTRVTTKPGGSGLGLPLVRLIAEAHGGSVWYRSVPGKGAAFSLIFPTDPPS